MRAAGRDRSAIGNRSDSGRSPADTPVRSRHRTSSGHGGPLTAEAGMPVATSGTPAIGAAPRGAEPGGAIEVLQRRRLRVPIDGVDVEAFKGAFTERRAGDGGHTHEAVDILAPRNTPVRAVEDGTIAKLFDSKAGGHTIYQFDPDRTVCLLLRASRPVRRRSARRPARLGRRGDRLRRHERQRPAGHATPAFRDLRARAGKALVEGRGAGSVSRLQEIALDQAIRNRRI